MEKNLFQQIQNLIPSKIKLTLMKFLILIHQKTSGRGITMLKIKSKYFLKQILHVKQALPSILNIIIVRYAAKILIVLQIKIIEKVCSEIETAFNWKEHNTCSRRTKSLLNLWYSIYLQNAKFLTNHHPTMLLNRTEPQKSLYSVGAYLIGKLRESTEPFYAVEMFEKYGNQLNVSFPQFMLTLDWLFLAGLIDSNGDGRLKKCF